MVFADERARVGGRREGGVVVLLAVADRKLLQTAEIGGLAPGRMATSDGGTDPSAAIDCGHGLRDGVAIGGGFIAGGRRGALLLIRLSGRQMKRKRPFTEPALLAGLWVLLAMLDVLDHYTIPDLRRAAAICFPRLEANRICVDTNGPNSCSHKAFRCPTSLDFQRLPPHRPKSESPFYKIPCQTQSAKCTQQEDRQKIALAPPC